MAKRRKDRHGGSGRVTPPSRPKGRVWPEDEPELPPLEIVLSALDAFEGVADRTALEIELTVSNFLAALGSGSVGTGDDDEPDYEDLVDGIVEVCLHHLDHDPPAVVFDCLWALDAFGLHWLAWPLHERLTQFGSPPDWVRDVGRSTIVGCRRISHETGDGDDIAIIARHAGAEEDHVLAVYVDRTLGGLVTDVLAHPEAVRYLELSAESGLVVEDLDPATAAAIINRGIDRTFEAGVPAAVSESFSACFELLDHLLAKLPDDGTPPSGPTGATGQELGALVDRFLGSLTGMKHHAEREVLLAAVEFVNDELGGDPLRWTASVTQVMLRAWLPVAGFDADVVERFPDLLRAFVPWAHAEHGWGDRYLAEAREVIDADPEPAGGVDVLQQALAAGVDLDDEDALDAFLDDYLGGDVEG